VIELGFNNHGLHFGMSVHLLISNIYFGIYNSKFGKVTLCTFIQNIKNCVKTNFNQYFKFNQMISNVKNNKIVKTIMAGVALLGGN
jgi:hypothetical protein